MSCLADAVAGLTGASVERRHEELMEWAEVELGLERGYAEQVWALAEEEKLLPIYGFLLIRCGVGVRELETPEQDETELAAQQEPPEWLEEEAVELDDVALERRLRSSFRRLRRHLEEAADAVSAAQAFMAEPDVGALTLRP